MMTMVRGSSHLERFLERNIRMSVYAVRVPRKWPKLSLLRDLGMFSFRNVALLKTVMAVTKQTASYGVRTLPVDIRRAPGML